MKSNKKIPLLCVLLLSSTILVPMVNGINKTTETDQILLIDGKIIDIEPLENLPSYFSWRDINGVDFTTSVKNQCGYPSCESFAMMSAVETMVQYEVGYPFGCDLSEAHLFFFSGGVIDWGSYPENDTKFLKEYGVPDEACWPYPTDGVYQYPLNTTSPDWRNRTVKISDWYYLPEDREAIKTALITNGPVPTYFMVYKDFLYYKKGIYQHRWGPARGPHYVCIMGYNDDPGYWIVKNSWGTNYQNEGWFNIRYGECDIEKKSFYLTGVYGQFPIVYVDDDNTQGPWNGSIDYPYQTIQDAIDNVYSGYTIYVFNGTYAENVIINKTVNLDGEDKTTTIIDGGQNDSVITVSAPGVRVSGFTIQNSSRQLFNAGIKTLSLKSNVTIRDNILQNNDIGVFLNYAYENAWSIVENNIIQNNRQGIYAHWINNNKIMGNTITMNSEMGLEMARCEYSTITGNQIHDNGDIGIYLRGSSDQNSVEDYNTISNHNIGIKIAESHRNRIISNNFMNNTQQAYIYNAFMTKWRRNYWNQQFPIFPKIIRGHLGTRQIPYRNFDWFTKRNLYDLV